MNQHKNGISALATGSVIQHGVAAQAQVDVPQDSSFLGHPIFWGMNTLFGDVKNALHGTDHALRPKIR
jgi:hypothetical protein